MYIKYKNNKTRFVISSRPNKSCLMVVNRIFFRSHINLIIILFLFFLMPFRTTTAQELALKTNLLYDAATIPSFGMEVSLSKNYTVNVCTTYCPFTYNTDNKWRNWSIQPELRHWLFFTPFFDTYIGVSTIFGGFNLANLSFLNLEDKRVQGTFFGGGFTLGCHRILSPHWGIEGGIGLGYIHASYSRYLNYNCAYSEGRYSYSGFYPVGLTLSLVYVVK